MKKNLILPILLGCSLFSCNSEKSEKKEYRKVPCTVLSVKHYGVGQIHTLQFDPFWEVTTGCGKAKMKRPYSVGDTIWVYYVNNK